MTDGTHASDHAHANQDPIEVEPGNVIEVAATEVSTDSGVWAPRETLADGRRVLLSNRVDHPTDQS